MKKENTDKIERQSAAAAEKSEEKLPSDLTNTPEIPEQTVKKFPLAHPEEMNYKNQDEFTTVQPNKRESL